MRKDVPIKSAKLMFYTESIYGASVVRVTLLHEVDRERLQSAVDEAVRRLPWVTYGIEEDAGDFYYHDGLSSHLTVMDWDEKSPAPLGGPEADYHLMGVYHKDRTIVFAVFHGLTDGRGLRSFVDATLSAYVGAQIPQSLTDKDEEPIDVVDSALKAAGLDQVELPGGLGAASAPMMVHEHLLPYRAGLQRYYTIRASAADLMRFARERGIKASAALVTLYAATLCGLHPESADLKIALPADFRGVLGIPETFRNCAMPPLLFDIHVPQNSTVAEIAQTCSEAIAGRTTPAAKLLSMKGLIGMQAQMPSLPFAQMEALISQNTTPEKPHFTFNCSYVGRYTDEPFLDDIESIYTHNPAFGTGSIVIAIATPESFFITLNQDGDTSVYVDAFVTQLHENGIDATLEHVFAGDVPYVEIRESWGQR